MTVENKEGFEGLTAEQIKSIVAERDEAKRIADEYKTHRDNVIEELKELRAKKNEIKDQANNANGDELEEKLKKVLQEKEAQEALKSAEQRRREAWDTFLREHKEFSPENDIAGLRLAALEKKLARFNLAGLSSIDELKSVYEDAVRLVRNESVSGTQNEAPYSSNPKGAGATPPTPGEQFTESERAVYEKLGWSSQKYAEMKLRHPALVNDLLNR